MNERSNDRFESLISAAVVDCVYQTADEFCAVDTSAVPSTPRLYKKVMRNLPGRKRTTVKTIIAVALIAAMLALTACACSQEIRDYFRGVIAKWYEDHFEISFVPENESTEEIQTVDQEGVKPTTIEQVAKLTYLPNGCYKANEVFLATQYLVVYDRDNERLFAFLQGTYDATKSFLDCENVDAIYVQVNGNAGALTEKTEGTLTTYSLIWQDDQFRYSLQGSFSSVVELIRIAESVSLE